MLHRRHRPVGLGRSPGPRAPRTSAPPTRTPPRRSPGWSRCSVSRTIVHSTGCGSRADEVARRAAADLVGRRSRPAPRRTAVASVGLWLAVPVLAAGLVGSTVLRSGARSYVACWLLLVAWFVLARTKTLRWSSVARLFVAGVPVAVVTAFVSERAGVARRPRRRPSRAPRSASPARVEELAKLAPLAVICLVAPGRVRRFALVDWALVGRRLGPRLPGRGGRRPPHLVVGDRPAAHRRRRPVGRPALGVPPLPLVAAERERRHRRACRVPRPPRAHRAHRAGHRRRGAVPRLDPAARRGVVAAGRRRGWSRSPATWASPRRWPTGCCSRPATARCPRPLFLVWKADRPRPAGRAAPARRVPRPR